MSEMHAKKKKKPMDQFGLLKEMNNKSFILRVNFENLFSHSINLKKSYISWI